MARAIEGAATRIFAVVQREWVLKAKRRIKERLVDIRVSCCDENEEKKYVVKVLGYIRDNTHQRRQRSEIVFGSGFVFGRVRG